MDENLNYYEKSAAYPARGSMTNAQIAAEQISFMNKVYMWMSLALVVTGVVAMYVASNIPLVKMIVFNKVIFYGLLIGELALVWYLSSAIESLSSTAATGMFLVYAAVNGLTLSVVFLVFTAESIASTFFLTAATFGIMSAFGYFTKSDLTAVGSFATMGLIGVIIASIFNMFMHSTMIHWIITYAGLAVFIALTAYDTQKIKDMNIIGNEGTEEDQKEAVMGALTLYLDFINLFLYMLQLFGDRRR
jgi:hypothetical protein